MPRKQKKYHIIYKVTNLLNDKYYIGMHSTDDLDDGYFGSGVYIRRSIKKYGIENHQFEILEYCSSREDLKLREELIVNEKLVADAQCMNLKIGGIGGFSNEAIMKSHLVRKERSKIDEEYRQYISATAKSNAKMVSEQGRLNCSTALKEKYKNSDFANSQKINAAKGNKASWSDDAKIKRKENRKKKIEAGWVWVLFSNSRKFIHPNDLQKYLDNGWILSRKDAVEMNQLNATKVVLR